MISVKFSSPGPLQAMRRRADGFSLYSYGNSEETTEAIQTEEPAAVISTVLPNTTYTFSIQAAGGVTVLNGAYTVTTPEATSFSQYGLTPDQVFMATFPTPEDPDWAKDLVPEGADHPIYHRQLHRFCPEATQGVTSSDEEVEALIVVRDAQGVPVDYYTGSAQWHTMWTGSKYLGQLERTPQTPGDYQLEVYFNRQLVRSMTLPSPSKASALAPVVPCACTEGKRIGALQGWTVGFVCPQGDGGESASYFLEIFQNSLFSPTSAHTKGGRRRMEMKGYSFAITMGLGAAVGAVAVLMMPRQNPARRLADKAAANVEDAVCQAASKIAQ